MPREVGAIGATWSSAGAASFVGMTSELVEDASMTVTVIVVEGGIVTRELAVMSELAIMRVGVCVSVPFQPVSGLMLFIGTRTGVCMGWTVSVLRIVIVEVISIVVVGSGAAGNELMAGVVSFLFSTRTKVVGTGGRSRPYRVKAKVWVVSVSIGSGMSVVAERMSDDVDVVVAEDPSWKSR